MSSSGACLPPRTSRGPHDVSVGANKDERQGSLWSALGGDSRTQLLVHCPSSLAGLAELARVVPAIAAYPERALLLARAHDVVCVGAKVDPAYLAYLAELGIGPRAENVLVVPANSNDRPGESLLSRIRRDPRVLRSIADRLMSAAEIVLNPHFASSAVFDLANELAVLLRRPVSVAGGSADVAGRADRKHLVRKMATDLGIPVARGEIVELTHDGGCMASPTALRQAINRQIHRTGRVIVRGSNGASGSSLFMVEARADSVEAAIHSICERRDNRWYLVEEMVDILTSPNVLLHVGATGIDYVEVTDQRWSAPLVYGGNAYPSRAHVEAVEQMVQHARTLAGHLRREGFTGLAGFDFCERLEPPAGEPPVMLAEVNPRVNGAAYPLMLLERLDSAGGGTVFDPPTAFASGRVRSSARYFSELVRRGGASLLRERSGMGVVPFGLGCLAFGEVQAVAIAPTRVDAEALLHDFELRCA